MSVHLDITSAEFIISLKMKNIKIASFHNNHPELIRYICDHHEGIIHISLGMITDKELNDLEKILTIPTESRYCFISLHTSNYPCPFEDLHLDHISYLKERSKQCSWCGF